MRGPPRPLERNQSVSSLHEASVVCVKICPLTLTLAGDQGGTERSTLSLTVDEADNALEESFDFMDDGESGPATPRAGASPTGAEQTAMSGRGVCSGDVFVKDNVAIDPSGVVMRDNPKSFQVCGWAFSDAVVGPGLIRRPCPVLSGEV